MKYLSLLLLLLGALLLPGCATMDAEERDFYLGDVVSPRMDADERAFWYSGWWKPGQIDQTH